MNMFFVSRLARHLFVLALGGLLACAATPSSPANNTVGPIDTTAGSGRGITAAAPWLSFYGSSVEMGDLGRAAATFRLLNIDADPDAGNFTPDQIAVLRANGRNRVISYLNVGACETYRSYWRLGPAGFVSCNANSSAKLGAYAGYSAETWMNPADPDYASLIVDYVAPRLAAQGVDGFFLDNLEIVERGSPGTTPYCDARCRQGGLDLVARLRRRFPNMLIVMQNATSDVTRLGRTSDGTSFPLLLDGISHEEVYVPPAPSSEAELVAWAGMGLRIGSAPFWIGTEDYVGQCGNVPAAQRAYTSSRARGFSPYATDSSAGQRTVCYWTF